MWLIVAEKDKTAKRIAHILFKDVKRLNKYGVNYYFSPSQNAIVLGLKGHIVEVDFPSEYNDWRKTPLRSLLKAKFVWRVKEKNIAKLLVELARNVDRVTVATDYDREGELIGVEALKIIGRVNPNIKVDRVRFSAVTPTEIRKAFRNPTKVDYSLAKSAEVRQKVDLLWGAVLTRLLSLSSGRMGKDFLSAGRVQSPTLRLIVERERQIEEFKSKKYWEVYIRVKGIDAKLEGRFDSEEKAKEVLSIIGDRAVVVSFEEKSIEEGKPVPFNTTEFLKEASMFMSPDRAMKIAEDLYMSGYISYPRTDNTVYPRTLNLRRIVEMFLNSDFGEEARLVLEGDMVPSKGRKETKDHPPIHPTAVASREELKGDEWKIYELVVRRFLATLAPKAVWNFRKVELSVDGLRFRATGKTIVEKGWRMIYTYVGVEEKRIPRFRRGEVVRIERKWVEEKRTKPPQRYTTGRLIKVMEKLGLGTKSTRHEIIRKLYSRGYVRGNPLRPTSLARAVIEALKKNVELITIPDMTAKLERYMDAIAEGKLEDRVVLLESVKFLDRILREIDEEEIGKRIREGIKEDKRKEMEKNALGPCPKCGGVLIVKRVGKRFIGCSNYPKCEFSLPLPQKGRLYITSDVCDEHKLKKIKIRTKDDIWDLGCPYCNYLRRSSDL